MKHLEARNDIAYSSFHQNCYKKDDTEEKETKEEDYFFHICERMDELSSPPQSLRSQINEFNIRAKKQYGQNFLIEANIIHKIIVKSEVQPGEHVLEIGPGLGFLTSALLEAGARVTAVEKDPELVELLTAKFEGNQNLTLIEGDILSSYLPPRPYRVIANIPYNITSPILHLFLLAKDEVRPTSLTIMMQKEVGKKLMERGDYTSLLSLLVDMTCTEKKIITGVSPQCFHPAPRVDSSVIYLKLKDAIDLSLVEKAYSLAQRAFSGKRKMLKNTLADSFGELDLDTVMQSVSIKPDSRPEHLSIQNWLDLAGALM